MLLWLTVLILWEKKPSLHYFKMLIQLFVKRMLCFTPANAFFGSVLSHLSALRIVREGKERRRKWAERLTPRPPQNDKMIKKEVEAETLKGSDINGGMLPEDIVSFLASREKQVFLSDTEEEKPVKKLKKKTKRPKKSGVEPVILKDIPPAHCLQNSLEFLKKRKMQVSRSSAVLNNSNQALRLLSTFGLLK